MAANRPNRGPQQSKLDKFARPKETETGKIDSTNDAPKEGADISVPQPSLAEIMLAIQGVQGALEAKMDTMAVDVNLLRADLRQMRDKVSENKVAIVDLQNENAGLKTRVQALEKTTMEHSTKLEDLEG